MTSTTHTDSLEHKLNLRNLAPTDYSDLKKIMDVLYPGMGGAWPEEKFRMQLAAFPNGQICIEDNGTVVAAALHTLIFGQHDNFHAVQHVPFRIMCR